LLTCLCHASHRVENALEGLLSLLLIFLAKKEIVSGPASGISKEYPVLDLPIMESVDRSILDK
jgi:hypothetical protein